MNRIKALFQDIADTIRQISGKTEKISPLNFSEEIGKIVTARSLLNKSITEYDFQNKTSIPAYAFHRCTNLQKIECPNINAIGEYAFYNCTSLSSIELPDTVETIGTNAFQGSGLTEVILPSNLTKLNGSTFYYCDKLKSITFNDKIESIGGYAFRDCYALTQDIILSESCKTIGQGAFQSTPINYLSGYFTSIAGGAFRDCTKLKTLVLYGDTVCTLASTTAFTNTQIASGEGYIYVPDNLVEDYKAATNWSTYETQIKPISEFNQEVNNNDTTN